MLIWCEWHIHETSGILPGMKSLSLSAPHVVIMVGVPGSGKSFFAEHFAQTFSAPLISWNAIRDELFNEPTYTKDEDAIVGRVADHMLSQLVLTNATVLYEGDTTTQVARQKLSKIVRDAGYEPLFVWVQTDAATTKSRAMKKGIPAEVYSASVKRFTSLKNSNHSVVISGKHTYASQLKIVLRRLSGARAAAATTEQPAERSSIKTSVGRRVRIQ